MNYKTIYFSSLVLIAAISCKKTESNTSLSSKDSTVALSSDSVIIKKDEAPQTSSSQPFSDQVTYRQFSFKVEAPNTEENNFFTLTPSGYSQSNEPQIQKLEKGEKVIKISFDDLDADNNPEVLIVTKKLNPERNYPYVYSSNGESSFGPVNFNESSTKTDYEGGDEYEVAEGKLVSYYPMSKNGTKTGKTKQISYKMINGEAMKQLKENRQSEY